MEQNVKDQIFDKIKAQIVIHKDTPISDIILEFNSDKNASPGEYENLFAVIEESGEYIVKTTGTGYRASRNPNYPLTQSVLRTNENVRTTNESLIDTNKSIKDINAAAKNLYEKILPDNFEGQKRQFKYTLALGILSTVFIGVTIWQKFEETSEAKLQALVQEAERLRTEVQNIRTSLIDLRTSIDLLRSDALNVRLMK